MQIVIDIPVMTFLNITSRELLLCSREDIEKLEFAIKNGTPLSENHGRLKDVDYLLNQYKEYCMANCPYTEMERKIMCRACKLGTAIEMLEDSPTIIEAIEKDMKVTEIKDYSNPEKRSIKVHNVWFDNEKVELKVNGERYTVNADELISAIERAKTDY